MKEEEKDTRLLGDNGHDRSEAGWVESLGKEDEQKKKKKKKKRKEKKQEKEDKKINK